MVTQLYENLYLAEIKRDTKIDKCTQLENNVCYMKTWLINIKQRIPSQIHLKKYL